MLYAPVLGTGHTPYLSESNRFVLSSHGQSALPRRRVVLAFNVIDYQLVLFNKIGLPICLLDTAIQLAQLLGEVVCLALNRSDPYGAYEFDFRSSSPSLNGRRGRREFSICVLPDLEHVPLGERIRQAARSEP